MAFAQMTWRESLRDIEALQNQLGSFRLQAHHVDRTGDLIAPAADRYLLGSVARQVLVTAVDHQRYHFGYAFERLCWDRPAQFTPSWAILVAVAGR
jgi:hypothetical protein